MVQKIECVEVNENAKSSFTVGNVYNVIRDLDCPFFFVINDNGEHSIIHRRTKKKEWYMYNSFFPHSSPHWGHVMAIFKYHE